MRAQRHIRPHVNPLQNQYTDATLPANFAADAFAAPLPLHVDIGCGKGHFCADLATHGWHADATAVLCTNLLFGRELDRRVSARLARCDTLRRVATLRPLPDTSLRTVCTVKLPFSWAERCRVYVYERR